MISTKTSCRKSCSAPKHENQHALLDRQDKAPDPFSAHLVLVAIVATLVLNGAAMLLKS